MAIVVAFTGLSNSGKTTLIEKLAKHFIKTHKVAVIKNDPKDKAIFDTNGKDSDKFSRTGAEVVVVSPTRTTLFSKRTKQIDEIIEMVGDIDIVLVEGLKTLELPRILVARDQIDSSYIDFCEAIATDGTVDEKSIPQGLKNLNLNDTLGVARWILQNGKEM